MSRRLQIEQTAELLGVKLSIKRCDIEREFMDIFNKLVIKYDKKQYPDSIFFFNDDICYMELYTKTNDLYCHYKHIWSVFEREYSMEYDDIQAIIKSQVEQHFKMKPITPKIDCVSLLGGAAF